MAIKKDKPAAKINYTIFHEKSSFHGTLNFSNPLKISGKFEGEINGSNLLLIEKEAKIDAAINVTHLIVFGKVTGNIIASEKVELREGAIVTGNIKTPNLEVDDGVLFEGQCEMKQAVKTTAHSSK